MSRRLLQRLAALIALAIALVVPLGSSGVAHAAIVLTCESHPVTLMPREWLPEAVPDACAAPAPADEGDDASRVAAMCDDRGASMVAPPLVRPVADARIDAACHGDDLSAPAFGPGPKHAPLAGPGFALADAGLPGDALLVPPASSELAPPYLAAVGAARAGFARTIEHPPR
jgi:hypothetical protein